MGLRDLARRDMRRILTREGDLAELVVYRTAAGDQGVRGVWHSIDPDDRQDHGMGAQQYHGEAYFDTPISEIIPEDGATIIRDAALRTITDESWRVVDLEPIQQHSWRLHLRRNGQVMRTPGRRTR